MTPKARRAVTRSATRAIFPNRLKEFRLKRRVRREELAAWSGLSLEAVRKLEQLRHSPRLTTARALAKYLRVSVNTLFPVR